MTYDERLLFVVKQQKLTGNVVTCYEAGAFGFHLHRRLEELGIKNYGCNPRTGMSMAKGLRTTDAAALCKRLDRYERGNKKPFSKVRIPTVDEERERAMRRQRQQEIAFHPPRYEFFSLDAGALKRLTWCNSLCMTGTMSEEISLQTIVDNHLSRVLSLRDSAVRCHAGLSSISEIEWSQYLSGMPPQPRHGVLRSHAQLGDSAQNWLVANALRDLIMLHSIYFEQIRQFCELARISALEATNEEKEDYARLVVTQKPDSTKACIEELDRLLKNGCPRKPEFLAFETLYLVFASRAAGQPFAGGDSPLALTLCVPEIKGEPDAEGNLPYSPKRKVHSFSTSDHVVADKALFYEIFFTAFTLCRDLAEACSFSTAAH